MDKTKPTKSESYISLEEQTIYKQIEKELFNEVGQGVFVKKDIPPTIDPNEACYRAIAVRVYGFDEYSKQIDAITDINYVRKNFHKSMLHESISANKIDIAMDLIRRGINVNIQDYRGNTALHYLASQTKNREGIALFQMILENGADVNLLDKSGKSVLWLLLNYIGAHPSQEQLNIVKKLIEMGADKEVLPKAMQEILEELLNKGSLSLDFIKSHLSSC